MLFTAGQMVAHLFGDYVIQSDWMASEKTKNSMAAAAHAVTYAIPFLFITQSWKAMAFIVMTHFVIDRWRLARYVCWMKNFLAPRWINVKLSPGAPASPEYERLRKRAKANDRGELEISIRNHPWSACAGTGYHRDKPMWMSVWLMIIADNCLHLVCNAFAIGWL
jgi:hypothetical protein